MNNCTCGLLLSITLLASTAAASCGGPPSNWMVMDTLENGDLVVGNGTYAGDTTYLSDLENALDSVISGNRNIAVATVKAVNCTTICSSDPCFDAPVICTVDVQIKRIISGSFIEGEEIRVPVHTWADGSTQFYYDFQDKDFLLYSDSLPVENLTIRSGCYSFEEGFFVENDLIYSRKIAFGHSTPISDIVSSQVRRVNQKKSSRIAGESLVPVIKGIGTKSVLQSRGYTLQGRYIEADRNMKGIILLKGIRDK